MNDLKGSANDLYAPALLSGRQNLVQGVHRHGIANADVVGESYVVVHFQFGSVPQCHASTARLDRDNETVTPPARGGTGKTVPQDAQPVPSLVRRTHLP